MEKASSGERAAGDAAGFRARLERIGRAVDRLLMTLASIALFAMMIVVSLDVMMRYLFNAPLSWAHDFVELYLIGGTVFLAMNGALRAGDHVAVDLVLTAVPAAAVKVIEVVINLIVAAVAATFLYVATGVTWEALIQDQRISGLIAWPIWPADLPACIGFAAMLVLSLWRVVTVFAIGRFPVTAPEGSI